MKATKSLKSQYKTKKSSKASTRNPTINSNEEEQPVKLPFQECVAEIQATTPFVRLETAELVAQCRKVTQEERDLTRGELKHINLGERFEIEVLYPGAYPTEFSQQRLIYTCDTCFMYFHNLSSLRRHVNDCMYRFNPPGDEIYRDSEHQLSVFLVKGHLYPTYTMSLCQLAMLWLKDKVLFLDTDEFEFYVLTDFSDESNCYVPVGYFSKQRNCKMAYNLSCFCVFPCYQQRGYGRFLIEMSYHISRFCGLPGGPERPLSSLGRLAYASYWKRTVVLTLDMLRKTCNGSFGLNDIVRHTGMQAEEIKEVLGALFKNVNRKRGQLTIDFDLLDVLAKVEDAKDKDKLYPNPAFYDPDFIYILQNASQSASREDVAGTRAKVEGTEREKEKNRRENRSDSTDKENQSGFSESE